MPYINVEDRPEFDNYIDFINIDNIGELNYCITRLCHNYLKEQNLNYANINEVIGVLECAKLELYRQIASKYEDKKKLANGAVSELDSLTLEDVR